MRTEHWRQGDAERTRVGIGRSIAVVAICVGLVGAAVFGFLKSDDAAESRRVAQDEAAQVDLLQVRVELAWLHHDLLTDALAGKMAERPFDQTLAEFEAERDRLLDEVRRLARLGGNVGPLADALADVHDDIDVGRWPIDAAQLDILHYDSMPFDGTAGSIAAGLDAHLDAVSVSMLPRLVLGDAVAIAMQRDAQRPPRWAVEYVEQTASIATDNPGWFGPTRQSPATNHVLSGPGDADGVFRNVSAIATAADAVEPSMQRTWDYDQWIIAGDLDSTPPATLDELIADVDEISEAFAAGFRAGLAEERAAIIDAAPAETAATMWFLVAIASLAGLALGLTIVMVRQWRRHRSLTHAAYVDGLTGAFNRRFLNEEVEGWCARRSAHVAIAMVDLDRFKLVNDTWGHAAGDAVLIEAARRLALAAAGVRSDDVDATSAVVRIGGDEFLLAWIGTTPFDTGAIDAAIRDVAGPVDAVGDESIPLELSIGIAAAPTPASLDDLMRAADLAVYADKDDRTSVVPTTPVHTTERA